MKVLNALAFLSLLAAASAIASTTKTVVLDVQNMTCPVCPITVKKSLEKVPGVIATKIDFDHKTATISFDPDKTTDSALTQSTGNAGFPSTLQR